MKLVILGTGGTCLDIAEAAELSGNTVVGFLDDGQEKGSTYEGFPILGTLRDAPSLPPDHMFCNGIGSPRSFTLKAELIAKTKLSLDRFVSVVHPSASVSPRAKLEPGVAVLQNAVISANAWIGSHVVVLPTSVVSHDASIGAYSCVAGGVIVCGNVQVGTSCYLGAGSVIRDGVTVADRSLIGMGAVVIGDVSGVVVGNPGRAR